MGVFRGNPYPLNTNDHGTTETDRAVGGHDGGEFPLMAGHHLVEGGVALLELRLELPLLLLPLLPRVRLMQRANDRHEKPRGLTSCHGGTVCNFIQPSPTPQITFATL